MESPKRSFREHPENPLLVRCNDTGKFFDRREVLGEKLRTCDHHRSVYQHSRTLYQCADCGRYLHLSQI